MGSVILEQYDLYSVDVEIRNAPQKICANTFNYTHLHDCIYIFKLYQLVYTYITWNFLAVGH